jgi:hypothetical protein
MRRLPNLLPIFMLIALLSPKDSAKAALPTIAFESVEGHSFEDAGSAELFLRRSGNSNSLATVAYTIVPETAKAGSDYRLDDGELLFAPAETNRVLSIPLFDNSEVDGDRTFLVILTKTLTPR